MKWKAIAVEEERAKMVIQNEVERIEKKVVRDYGSQITENH